MLVDALGVVVQALQAAGWTNVHPDPAEQIERISPEALAGEDYIWVEEDVGTTPHAQYADRPQVRVINYSADDAREKARRIQRDLAMSCGQKFPAGGIHRVLTTIRPYRQEISGLPPGVVRMSALYELVLSTEEKWD